MQLQIQGTGGWSQQPKTHVNFVGVEHDTNAREAWHDFLEQRKPLAEQPFVRRQPRSGDIGAWPSYALDEPQCDRVTACDHDKWNGFGGVVSCLDARCRSDVDDIRL